MVGRTDPLPGTNDTELVATLGAIDAACRALAFAPGAWMPVERTGGREGGPRQPRGKTKLPRDISLVFGRGRPSATRPAAVLSRPDNPAQSVVSHP
jgi:hypothetical protein